MKSLKSIVLTFLLLFSASQAFAQLVPYNICETKAKNAAQAVFQLCTQNGGSIQECREQAQSTYEAIYKACVSSLIDLNTPQIEW